MPFPGFSGWIVQLDPSGADIPPGTTRTMLDINNPTTGIQIGGTSSGQGVDWGTSALTQMMSQEGQWGSAPADFIAPNRTVTIPLGLGMGGPGTPNANTALANLAEKVGLLQRQGGWLLRQRAGGSPMYLDIVDAQLAPPDVWGETGEIEPGVTLTLTCAPDFYGAEIALDSIAVTGYCEAVLTSSGVTGVIAGDYPARTRIVVTDTSGNNQNGLLWGLRSQHYDPATTAALQYECEALTPLNSAAVTTLAGASGGHVVSVQVPSADTWMPMLGLQLSTSAFTHQGTYRVIVRAYSATEAAQFQLVWGVGSLAVPSTNTAVQLPGAGAFYLLDLGTVRLNAQPVGANAWGALIQAMVVTADDDAQLDEVFFIPVDEGAGQLSSVQVPSSSVLFQNSTATLGADDSSIGTVAWTNPTGIETYGSQAIASLTNSTVSHYLDCTDFGFSVPSGATITGIEVQVKRGAIGGGAVVFDDSVKLLKAGSVVGSNRAVSPQWNAGKIQTYGSSTDLWGTTWTTAQINASNFGFAIAGVGGNPSGTSQAWVFGQVTMLVYYTLGSGLSIPSDAVVYANQPAQLGTTSGMYRTDDGNVYGPVSSVIGDLPRLPPSGLEQKPVQIFCKPSRGTLNTLPDAGLDGMTVKPYYRPCYLARI